MSIENLFPIFFLTIFALAIGPILYKVIKHGGFKAAVFGTHIERTIGAVSGGGMQAMRIELKVHKLGGESGKAVGIEIVTKSFASYQMLPVALSVDDAKKLIALLEEATGA